MNREQVEHHSQWSTTIPEVCAYPTLHCSYVGCTGIQPRALNSTEYSIVYRSIPPCPSGWIDSYAFFSFHPNGRHRRGILIREVRSSTFTKVCSFFTRRPPSGGAGVPKVCTHPFKLPPGTAHIYRGGILSECVVRAVRNHVYAVKSTNERKINECH